MNGTVLITGAGGFVGSHLVERLAADHDVVAWARSVPDAPFARLGRWTTIDLLDRRAVHHAIAGLKPSAVYHCAGYAHTAPGWSDSARPFALNVLLTHHLFDALRVAGQGCRVLLPGSATVYAPSSAPHAETDPLAPEGPYALSKLAQEQLGVRAVAEDGVDVILTRSFNHTGPRQSPAFAAPGMARQIALIERGALPAVLKVGNLESQRDLSDVRDVTAAYEALMRDGTPGTIYNVASGIGRTIGSVLHGLLALTDTPVAVETDPGRVRGKDIPVLVGDPSRLRDATGWTSRIPFEQTLADLLGYWRSSPLC